MTDVPEVRTERLLMRGWREEDFEGWAAICADDEVMRPLGQPGGLDDPEAWKNLAMWVGYATEAARAACEWGHGELGLRHIISLIEPSNTRSIRVAQKLGETVEGHFQLREFDLLVYGADLPLGSAA